MTHPPALEPDACRPNGPTPTGPVQAAGVLAAQGHAQNQAPHAHQAQQAPRAHQVHQAHQAHHARPGLRARPGPPEPQTQPGQPAWRQTWLRVLALYGVGLLAAAQLGKLSALAPLLAPDLGLSLTTSALAISLLELAGALFAGAAAWLAQRFGLGASLRLGLVALAVGGLGSALSRGAADLLAWRLLESLGYLAAVISVPVLLARAATLAGPRTLGSAMALWSSFVPVGLALGAWAAGSAAQALGWRVALGGGGVLTALVALAAWRLGAGGGPRVARAAPGAGGPAPGAAALCLALAFGCFTLLSVGVLALLPTLLVTRGGASPAWAAQITALASLANILGSVAAALLLRHGVAPRLPMLLALVGPALLLPALFVPSPQPLLVLGLSVLQQAMLGLFASLAFALLPVVSAGTARLPTTIAWLTQAGASGALLGPPLMAAGVQQGGWGVASALGMLVAALALPLVWRASRPAEHRAEQVALPVAQGAADAGAQAAAGVRVQAAATQQGQAAGAGLAQLDGDGVDSSACRSAGAAGPKA